MVNCFKDIVKYVDTDSYDVQIIIITIILWDASEKKKAELIIIPYRHLDCLLIKLLYFHKSKNH